MLVRSALIAVALSAGATNALAADPDQKVRIVVLRMQQGFGANAPADILEVNDGRLEYIGRVWQGEKLVLEVPPAKKHYMTVGYGGRGEFFFAEPLTPGQTYYVALRFHPASGAMTPIPVRRGSAFPPDAEAVKSAISGYKAVVPTKADRDEFAKTNGSSVEDEYVRIRDVYRTKTPVQISERALFAGDAVEKTP